MDNASHNYFLGDFWFPGAEQYIFDPQDPHPATASESQHDCRFLQERYPQVGYRRLEPGYSTFPATEDSGRKHKRTKFEDPKRRNEVAQVRKEGACMRCRWNKIPVR